MDNPCKHLVDYKLRYGLSGFKCLQKYVKSTPNGRTSIVKSGNKVPRCSFCNNYRGRLYICLICHAISCKSHILSHTQLETGHDLFVDVERSELYCSLCGDQVYDPDFDNVVVSKSIMDMPGNSNCSFEYVTRRSSKRRRLDLMVDLDLKKARRLAFFRDGKEKSCYPLGLRGLNNLGSTCFMNSVLQALVHAPPFRNYFLSDRHERELCKKRSSLERVCLTCEIAVIFSAVFSGDRTPYTPAQFLYSWWQHSSTLASYEQQDAHDFFMSLLDGIHEKEGKERTLSKGNGDCPCIAHRVFSGLLRSDVTCMTCGFTSTTYDPCVDISLNFDSSNVSDAPGKSVRPNNTSTTGSTLSACLDFFTRPEKLGSDQKLYCQNCHEKRDSVKQMSIRRLPLVLSMHIKRFEHSPVRRTSKKIDWHLRFPFSLDMTPYLSSSIVRSRFGNRVFAFETDEADTSAEFEIFAVVTHSGMLESGHYVTYLRMRNQWYKCDDAWVTEVDEEVVRSSQCYMLFYVQKTFYYKAYEDFSGTHVLPRRELLHPIAGCC